MTRSLALYILTLCLLSGAAAAAAWFCPIQIESDATIVDAEEDTTLPKLSVPALHPVPSSVPVLPPEVKIKFVDVAAKAGIEFRHFDGQPKTELLAAHHSPLTTPQINMTGSGIGWLDYDRDGLLDLFMVQGSTFDGSSPQPAVTCKLFKNLGGGKFKDVTQEVGLAHVGCGQGVAVGDIDNDGYPDLFLTCFGKPNVLYHNIPDGKSGRRFQDITAQAGLAELPDWKSGPNYSTSAAFLDYNNDGYLDLFVCSYLGEKKDEGRRMKDEQTRKADSSFILHPSSFHLYRNNGNGTFTDVSHEAGIDQQPGNALGVVALDLDDHGLTDIYVVNDTTGNSLFRNLGNGRFQSLGPGNGCAVCLSGTPQAYRGVDAEDVDADGRPDLFSTAFSQQTKTLWRNEGSFQFLDISLVSGLTPASWFPSGFGTCFLDVDRDGSPDIFITNGHVLRHIDDAGDPDITFRQTAQLFLNNGKGHFVDVSAVAGPYFLERHVGRSVAYADYDNDGRMDLALNNAGEPAVLLHNESSTPHHWVRIELQGAKCNRDAVGAKVIVHAGDKTIVRHRKGGGGYLCSSDPRLLIGLGAAARVAKVEIRWPGSAQVQQLGPLAVDRGYLIIEGVPEAAPRP